MYAHKYTCTYMYIMLYAYVCVKCICRYVHGMYYIMYIRIYIIYICHCKCEADECVLVF